MDQMETNVITHSHGSARVLYKGDDESLRGRGKFDPRHSKTPQPILAKIWTRDYVGDDAHRTRRSVISARNANAVERGNSRWGPSTRVLRARVAEGEQRWFCRAIKQSVSR